MVTTPDQPSRPSRSTIPTNTNTTTNLTSTSPPRHPRKRRPCHLSLFDLPARVRSRIYTHYFTYPSGLHMHLIYSGHFPRPSLPPPSSGPTSSAEAKSSRSKPSTTAHHEEEWPFPSEPPYAPTSYAFSTTLTTPLPSPAAHHAHLATLYPSNATSNNISSPTSDHFPATRNSTLHRLRELHSDADLGTSYDIETALLRVCRAVNHEARGLVWRCNVVCLVTDGGRGFSDFPSANADAEEESDDDDAPKDGKYHLHLGVLPAEVLRGIRELVLPAAEVVGELPSRSVAAGDLVVQRRVWGVVEREMPGLRGVGVGVGFVAGGWGEEIRGFLGWCVAEAAGGRWNGKVLVEVGELLGWRVGNIKGKGQGTGLEGFVVQGKNARGGAGRGAMSGNRAEGLVARMVLPGDVREVRIKMILPKTLWKEFEELRWGDVGPVKVGGKNGMALYDGDMVAWDAAVFEMRSSSKGEREGKGAEGLQGKVHESLKTAAKGQEAGKERRTSLTDKVYEKLRLKG